MNISYPSDVTAIAKLLRENSFEAYAVGGCVRDSIMKKAPSDWDITTSASPQEMLSVFSAAGLRTIPTGMKHGTVSVIIGGRAYECTTYRIDGEYKDSRRPESVEFTKNIADDLSRRDFTVNSLAGDPLSKDCRIIDLFEGIEDIQKKIIRCVGDPIKRFGEDALRILRAVRFATVLGFDIDGDTARAAELLGERLRMVSAERKTAELEKILLSDNADRGVALLCDMGLSQYIHPDIKKPEISLSALDRSFAARLSALFLGDVKPELSCLKLSNAVSEKVALLCDGALYQDCLAKFKSNRGATCRLLLSKFGSDARSAALLRSNGELCELLAAEEAKNPCVSVSSLAIGGSELLNINIENKKIGRVMSSLLLSVIENPKLNTREQLLGLAAALNEKNI